MTSSTLTSKASRIRLAIERERRKRRRAHYGIREILSSRRGLESPDHLGAFIELLERALSGEEVRAVVTTPPQHGKSLTTFAGLIYAMQHRPELTNAYVTYAKEFANSQNLKASTLAAASGLELKSENLNMWATHENALLLWTAIQGRLTGIGIDGLLIVDDPIKNPHEARSRVMRQRVAEWFSGVAMARVHPGASVIVVQTRWHPDDLAGRLIKEGWESVKLPAINDEGEALWPSRRPLEWLERQRKDIGEHLWAALYMCEPRLEGTEVFKAPTYYDELPDERYGYREAVGADWATTASSSADYSVGIKGRLYKLPDEPDPVLYLTDMVRAQLEAPQFAAELLRVSSGARVFSYISGTEKGNVQWIRSRLGVKVRVMYSSADKYAKAQRTGASWNWGRIRVPRSAPWAPVLVEEVTDFTGIGDLHDDIVDALASLHDGLNPLRADAEEIRRRTG